MSQFKDRKEVRMWRLRKSMFQEKPGNLGQKRLDKLKAFYFSNNTNKKVVKIPRANFTKKKDVKLSLHLIKDPSEINFMPNGFDLFENPIPLIKENNRKYFNFYKGVLSCKSSNSKTIDFTDISKDDEFCRQNNSNSHHASIIKSMQKNIKKLSKSRNENKYDSVQNKFIKDSILPFQRKFQP